MSEVIIENAKSLLAFNDPWSVETLDQLVDVVYGTYGEQQSHAQCLLMSIKGHNDAWTKVDQIIEKAKNQQTKYFGLQILEEAIKKRWKALPRSQCNAIKEYVTNLIVTCLFEPKENEGGKLFLSKLNHVLVEILKYEWPNYWETFIPDLVQSSYRGEALRQNNMEILKLLSEEVFDFSNESLTTTKAQAVLEESDSISLLTTTLDTLLIFINWIPHGYCFETTLPDILISKYLSTSAFRDVTIKCLTEIVALKPQTDDEDSMNKKILILFSEAVKQIIDMIPIELDIRTAYNNSSDNERNFIMNLAIFFITVLKTHSKLIESDSLASIALSQALVYMVNITEVDEIEVFKVCVEYWVFITADLIQSRAPLEYTTPFSVFDTMRQTRNDVRSIYDYSLTKVRSIMIDRMARPEEVIVVENENGEVVREFFKDTDAIVLYNTMKDCLTQLTLLDPVQTEGIMTEKLKQHVTSATFVWGRLNTLCWAIGSIAGTMEEENEKRFLVFVIKELLNLCEQKRGKDNKAIIASNIMYVVGQYPRFLRVHWKFLKTVINKLFEFMHETHEGVQDMACDTFIKIASKCKRCLVSLQHGESIPFILEIASNINSIICDLSPQQVQTFYEALGEIITAETDSSGQNNLVAQCMEMPNRIWDQLYSKAKQDENHLKDVHILKQGIQLLRINTSTCRPIGPNFIYQIARILESMIILYRILSKQLTEMINTGGENVDKTSIFKHMKSFRNESLILLNQWLSRCEQSEQIPKEVINSLFATILLDFKDNLPPCREVQVLVLVTTLITKGQGEVVDMIPSIFDAVFESTLSMIKSNLEDFLDFRIAFYQLIEAVIKYCFNAILLLSADQFAIIYEAVIWSLRHNHRDIVDLGFSTLHEIIWKFNTVANSVDANMFFQKYFIPTLEHIFVILNETSLRTGISKHTQILSSLFLIVDTGRITIPLDPSVTNTPNGNLAYVKQYTTSMFMRVFPHLRDEQIKIIVDGFIHYDQDFPKFKNHLRDFLIEIREHSGTDTRDLYLEERDLEIQKAAQDKLNKQTACGSIDIIINRNPTTNNTTCISGNNFVDSLLIPSVNDVMFNGNSSKNCQFMTTDKESLRIDED
ncbi:hypothetical protein GJ496_001942 [Pomphorhynchus laevis]|nr:hypothetical protein GJ496_001942 [Pomphorhynchus laevis]